ncbi:MAG: DegV family protein [Eubacteriales bacterium]|nr:DegV family protein [Eubacteriales bacterium]MDD3881350.1 DegV family protein [Eubacteriales bacterium]MDD4513677.1 DegV family protein [Eubacteriales bacterium]
MDRKIAIVTDTSCDLSDEQLSEYGIELVSLRVVNSSGEYRDRLDVQPEEIYDMMKQDLPKTSLPNPGDVSALYDSLIERGFTDVLHYALSSNLSGTFNMVRIIAEEYEGRLNVRVFDSKTLSTALGTIVLQAARDLRAGLSIDEILERSTKMRQSQLGMFIIRTLEYLRKGGRIGLVEGVLGTLLQLKPIVFVNDEGIYQTRAKARGWSSAVETMVNEMVTKFGRKAVCLSVVHGNAREDAQKLLERLKTILDVKESFIAQVSPALAIHTGPGLLGIIASEAL